MMCREGNIGITDWDSAYFVHPELRLHLTGEFEEEISRFGKSLDSVKLLDLIQCEVEIHEEELSI